nr:phage regulatory protein/antirepressor Ant [uncultured Acetobacterium sp.]
MNDLINIENKDGLLFVSSREIAERFDKRHNDVVKVIESKIHILTTENFVVNTYFIESSFLHNGNEYKEFLLTRDGFSFIAMGFTGSKADIWRLRYIEAFNQMENEIKRMSQPQGEEFLAQAVLYAQKCIEEKEAQLIKQKPKVLLADAITANEASISIKELAVILKQNGVDTGEKRLFEWMRSKGYLTKRRGKETSLPSQRSLEMGLLETALIPYFRKDGSSETYLKPMVTVKGRQYFINKLLG